ncbi:hypothetical protein BC936DRAFT_144981 [Jimgerdemannia flammicorona]|uniref:Galactose oxidase n=1 Tax=Jimgerdemannia flammicorona TaxID=994334 RepID=A0A433DB70_9FUNG|nr:hypothetical protein BC936DRAFT_144981 [Jimgerdemannia flammicorona]
MPTHSPPSIWIHGGISSQGSLLHDLWTLPISIPWSTASPPFQFRNISAPYSSSHVALAGGPDSRFLFLYGRGVPLCYLDTGADATFLFVVDASGDRFDKYPASVAGSTRLQDGVMFVYDAGMAAVEMFDAAKSVAFPIVRVYGMQEASPVRFMMTFTLLPNGMVVVVGGTTDGQEPCGLNEVDAFNTISLAWSKIFTSGKLPTARFGHSAVATADNKIIVYGGSAGQLASMNSVPIPDPLVILDANDDWSWHSINALGPPPPILMNHQYGLNLGRTTKQHFCARNGNLVVDATVPPGSTGRHLAHALFFATRRPPARYDIPLLRQWDTDRDPGRDCSDPTYRHPHGGDVETEALARAIIAVVRTDSDGQ